tara:strand:+ start:565 stop:876 length:312 start_codon:yes stop_codon:yes gene_type:complete
MAIYKNISAISGIGSGSPVTLVTKGGLTNGNVRKIIITNHDDSDSNVIQLHLFDGSSTTYVIAETTIPPRATLVLDDNLSFDSSAYNLRIMTSTDAELTIIIK